jgi:CxxC motif-containing protein (DUF1111 family)
MANPKGVSTMNLSSWCRVVSLLLPTLATLLITTSSNAATSDIDGDSKSDLVFRNSATGQINTWLMNGTTTSASATLVGPGNWNVSHTADFNGDGQADILFRHDDGSATLWLMNGLTMTSSVGLLGPTADWRVSHVGDFNGDGRADILWRNANGAVTVWLMDGTTVISRVGLLGPDPGWRVSHVADFNNDGKADLLWANANGAVTMWLMNGAAVSSATGVLGANADWSVDHVADFNADGKADLLWRNTNGAVTLWLMNGTAASTAGLLGANADWRVSHAADFNGDGKADILWRNTNGAVTAWLMSGTTVTSAAGLLGADPNWRVTHIGDYNGDGKSDLVWRNSRDGSVTMWLMNGTTTLSAAGILGATSWAVVPSTDITFTPTPNTPDYTPLYAAGTPLREQIQYTEADGTLVTLMGGRPTERHARERGEAWDAPDAGPGRYFTFPTFYFQNRTFGLEIRDEVPAGRQRITVRLRINDGTFDGTTFSLFRNAQDPTVRDYGWALNYGFNNPNEGNKPICRAGNGDCTMNFDSNWGTSPHSKLKVGDRIELAPAPRLARDANDKTIIDAGGSRYYSFEQLYVVGVGMRPWYGIVPNLDSAPLPDETLLGGQTSVSYNYSEEPMRVFQQMANNIGIANTKTFVQGRRLFHTGFTDGKHSEHPNENPVFTEHVGQQGPRFNQSSCIACHAGNGRSVAAVPGARLDTMSVVTAAQGQSDALYGTNVQQRTTDPNAADYAVSIQSYLNSTRTLPDGEKVELQKPVYAFKGGTPAQFSARQAPQVIGMGLLEAIDEAAVLALADPQDKNGDGVRGIPNWVSNPETGKLHLGRFGWKASKATLRHQTGDALIKDMSVTSPVFPSRSCQRSAADCRTASGITGISEEEVKLLADYLALIGVPAQRSLRSGYPAGIRVSPEHDVNPAEIARGNTLFAQVQCTSCHTPQMKTGNNHPFAELRNQTIKPYTNLLLHDMGPGLADTLAEGKASASMWRTAPLWGLGSLKFVQGNAANVRYLHDGRARTLMEAIAWHGGEADNSRTKFEALPKEDRAAILMFLESL